MTIKTPIYLDCQATTPLDHRVLEKMLPYFQEEFGNAASKTHSFGWTAEKAVEDAREQVATLISAQPKEIIFTSGATESNNLAIKGISALHSEKQIVIQATEHHAILDPCKALKKQNHKITVLPVDQNGIVSPESVAKAITSDTILVSIMTANNEIGTLQPITDICRICRERNVLFHTDATQAVGKLPLSVKDIGIDLLSLSAHKFYGPKGIGALYVRSSPNVRLISQNDGGSHERGMRSGTLNVPGIVGLGAACEIAAAEMKSENLRVKKLRNHLLTLLFKGLDKIYLNGHFEKRLSGNLNISFAGVDGESLLMSLREIALSSGSACTSATLEPSYVLRALQVEKTLSQSSIRFGLGRFTTKEEVEYVAIRTIEEVNRLREISPNYKTGIGRPSSTLKSKIQNLK